MLVEYFVQRYAKNAGKTCSQDIVIRTLERLHAYNWPGNIRELQNVIERSVILSSGDVFAVDDALAFERIVSGDPANRNTGARARDA